MRKRQSNNINNVSNGGIVAPFEAFENRIRKVIYELLKEDIMIDFSQEQLEILFTKVLSIVETSIFAEMEQIMNTIQGSLQVVAMESERKSLHSFMNNEINFKRFITHVVANYQSLREHRIDILMAHNPTYQGIEDELFGEKFITANSFQKAFDIHLEMIQAFHKRYHDLLFEGELLDKDNKIEESVIEPVIHQYKKEIQVDGTVE